jgi:DNA primase
MIDTTALKARLDLRTVIESDLGPPNRDEKWLCPFHAEDTPSFHVMPGGERWKCFGCGATGDVIDYVGRRDNLDFKTACEKLDGNANWTAEERESFLAEVAERKEQAREEQEAKRRQAYDQVAEMWEVAIQYAANLTAEHKAWWHAKGVNDETIGKYWLGYCPSCPTDKEGRPSYTIPVTFRGRLLNIRHRLAHAENGDKYRPQIAGLGAAVFNADVLLAPGDYVLVVEGEIKAMVLAQVGYRAVGIPGANSFKEKWRRWFKDQRTIYVALDPGANGHGEHIAALLGSRARVVQAPCKPDDFFVLHGGSADDFNVFLRQARNGHGR